MLEGLGKNLNLSEYTLKPSYDVLYYYGNVSSSTTWYTLSNIETLRGVRKGDKIMQVCLILILSILDGLNAGWCWFRAQVWRQSLGCLSGHLGGAQFMEAHCR